MKKTILIILLIIIGNLQATLSQVLPNNEILDTVYLEEKEVYTIDLYTTPDKLWLNYDFVSGKEILFFDSFDNEKEGEKPSKWNTLSGKAFIKNFENKNVLFFETANPTKIQPIIPSLNSLPKSFTLEFDIYFDRYANQSITEYWLYFNEDNESRIEFTSFSPLKIKLNSKDLPKIDKSIDYSSIPNFNDWHHVSLSYNYNKLKLYFDDLLIANEYCSSFRPKNIAIYGNTYDYRKNSNRNTLIRNFKIASGRSSLYSGIATKSKYTTNAISFNQGKPFFNSPSSGEIKRIYKFMHDNPNWNFNILAPNDNTINKKYNFEISTKRSQSIKDALVQLGINKKRLSVVGNKEPMYTEYNASTESKIENQKVEFILRP